MADKYDFTCYTKTTRFHLRNIIIEKEIGTLENPGCFEIRMSDRVGPPLPYYLKYYPRNCNLGNDLITLFRDFAEHNITWEELKIVCDTFHNNIYRNPLCELLPLAHELKLFAAISVWSEDGCFKDEKTWYFHGAASNSRLTSLSIDFHSSAIFKNDFDSLKILLENTTTLRSLKLKNMHELDNPSYEEKTPGSDGKDLLCEGLSNNNSLEDFELDLAVCSVEDEELALVISSLAKVPTLQQLLLSTRQHVGPSTSEALQSFFQSSTALLKFDWFDGDRYSNQVPWLYRYGHKPSIPNLNAILLGVAQSKSIQSVLLRSEYGRPEIYFGPHAVAKSEGLIRWGLDLFNSCPTLKEVHLGLHILRMAQHMTRIESKERLKQVGRTLEMYDFLPRGKDSEVFIETLQHHPEIRMKFTHSPLQDHPYICQLNWHGRYLLQPCLKTELPSALWSYVLAKAGRKPSLLYDFVKGLAPQFEEMGGTNKRSRDVGTGEEEHLGQHPEPVRKKGGKNQAAGY